MQEYTRLVGADVPKRIRMLVNLRVIRSIGLLDFLLQVIVHDVLGLTNRLRCLEREVQALSPRIWCLLLQRALIDADPLLMTALRHGLFGEQFGNIISICRAVAVSHGRVIVAGVRRDQHRVGCTSKFSIFVLLLELVLINSHDRCILGNK